MVLTEEYKVRIVDSDESYICDSTQNLLKGMVQLGRKGIPVGCRGGGCGVCKVQILSGSYTNKRMSREHVSVEDEAEGRVLACRTWPTSDIELQVVGQLQRAVTR